MPPVSVLRYVLVRESVNQNSGVLVAVITRPEVSSFFNKRSRLSKLARGICGLRPYPRSKVESHKHSEQAEYIYQLDLPVLES
ncbi:hypothetical protein M404DRAFT_992178, partial [Pisolithus tinctorius Marx 270]